MKIAVCAKDKPGIDRNRRWRDDGNTVVGNGFPTHSQPQTQYLCAKSRILRMF
jgi:hypothetical protein